MTLYIHASLHASDFHIKCLFPLHIPAPVNFCNLTVLHSWWGWVGHTLLTHVNMILIISI